MRESFYFNLISGKQRGVCAWILRVALTLIEPLYAIVITTRNLFFRCGVKRILRVNTPIISVGNITTGGTGKTPTVALLVRWIGSQGKRPGILSRGYRTLDGIANDEKLLLDQLCPNVPHVQNKNRFAGAQLLHAGTTGDHAACDVIVLDDGFQHRRLHRDFDLVLIDALNPWGYDHLLPRGLLREPLKNLKRADAILVTRCDQVSVERLSSIQQRLQTFADCPIFRSVFVPTGLINASGRHLPFEMLQEQQSCAFAGIGNPSGFRRTLASLGLVVSEERFLTFPDHYHYTPEDLLQITSWATAQKADSLIVTRKDLVKLKVDSLGAIPIWGVEIELSLLDANGELLQRLMERLQLDNPG